MIDFHVRDDRDARPSGASRSSKENEQGWPRGTNPHVALEQFEHFLAVVPTLPLSPAVARRCAWPRESLKGRGRSVRHRALDLVIAATALEHGLQLVTRNLADYEDIPELALHEPS
ncbi:MAG: type II toxin-antitoxin system VapC family toxin [Chloroflexia bacterium]|nr:type II toxin-antitoxin system VapC family toxin [Chloroflexia bacterium]